MKVAIAGYGVEGVASYRYYHDRGDEVVILDERETLSQPAPEGALAVLGPDAFSQLDAYDIVVRTPALRPDKLQGARKVWSATNEFFAKCPAPIIGVTGTKGKGTTSSLIASILKEAGNTVHLVGNIGTPALDILPTIQPTHFVVYELSSFQLWDLEGAPDTAVVLMIEPDHLDVHKDLEEYLQAKAGIVKHMGPSGQIFYHPTNALSARVATEWRDNPTVEAQRYGVEGEGGAYVQDDTFYIDGMPICPTSALQLPGAHNIENACAAISAAWGKANVTSEAVQKGLEAFTGLPHRLKFVREVDGVKYFDDSIATTPGSATAALRAFQEPKIIILGGSDKGADYQLIVDVCREVGARVIAIGQTGEKIATMCTESQVPVIRELGGMPQVVATARATAQSGDVVILSPASASFDQYKSYSDRGDQFVAAVKEI